MKIICVGKNYAKHAAELGSKVPEEPLVFLKPDSSILRKSPFFIPNFSKEIHYEVEVVLRIDRVGKAIEEKFAHRYYSQIGLGIDFTARDLQNEFRKKGFPWELSKGFDGATYVSEFYDKSNFDLQKLKFHLNKNSETMQRGNTSLMEFSFDRIVSFVSQFYTLKKGDFIFTGTPEGVGPVASNDLLEGYLDNKKAFQLTVK